MRSRISARPDAADTIVDSKKVASSRESAKKRRAQWLSADLIASLKGGELWKCLRNREIIVVKNHKLAIRLAPIGV